MNNMNNAELGDYLTELGFNHREIHLGDGNQGYVLYGDGPKASGPKYISVSQQRRDYEIEDEGDFYVWMFEKQQRQKRQLLREETYGASSKGSPDLNGHFWIEHNGKIIDYWFEGYSMICNVLNIKKKLYHKPFSEKEQRRLISAYPEDFTDKHRELLLKYWKMTALCCDYNVCVYKMLHPDAKIVYGEVGLGDDEGDYYPLHCKMNKIKKGEQLCRLIKKHNPDDKDRCLDMFELMNTAEDKITGFPLPFPNKKKKKKRKRKSQRQRQKANRVRDFDAVALYPVLP